MTAVVALTAAGLWVYQPPGYQLAAATGPVLALVALAVLAAAGQRLPRSWLWLAVGLLAAYLLARLVPSDDVLPVTGGLHISAKMAPYAVLGGTIFWRAADARPMAAAALLLAVNLSLASVPLGSAGLPWLLLAACSFVLAVAAIRRVRRQDVLSGPL